MLVKQIPVGQMKANCFILSDKKGEAIIIDPGDDADLVIQHVQRNDLTPRLIIGTHGHFDHLMSVLELKLAFNIPFYLHKNDEFLTDRLDSTAMHFLQLDPGPPPDIDVYLKNKADIKVGDISLKVIHTPGHTPGSVCLYEKKEKIIFVGDVIFKDGMLGRTDFSYSDKSKLKASARLILKLPEDTEIFPGHGEATDVGSLLGTL